ncbi:metallophosphoesterase family protein [Rhodococcus sp. P1Y]|uniref:metallophosphoesterase family protein n=1 Tax=Rhodococcus sp. P1Y TaxID=1302308 RepID=UPI000EAF2EA5|nr:metallophosphoesterase [Rhodococcus sp. P1Y]AYJ50798.1 metallophosphoesterase [Rhodococcus sp. P1Y]
MVSVLAVSDETIESLWNPQVRSLGVDLILGAGDLPFDYLEYLTDVLNAPCVFVPGNHDADLTGYSAGRAGWMRAGLPSTWPGPVGAINADRRIVTAAGLRIAGLGGSIRYNGGPNQWTQRQQRRRARSLTRTQAWAERARGDRRGIDVLLTHSPPFGVGDGTDPAHVGFECLDDVVRSLQPQILLHGHIHPHGRTPDDLEMHGSAVVNTVGYTLLEIEPGRGRLDAGAPTILRRRHGT